MTSKSSYPPPGWFRKYISYNPGGVVSVLIILLSLLIRLLYLNKTAFFVNDQGRDLLVLYNLVHNQQLTLIGPATSLTGALGNIYFGPFYYYYLIPFYMISSSPIFITILFPILFSFGLLLFSRIKSMDWWQKITFLLLSGSSWYLIYYTTFIWNLNLAIILSLILFSTLLIYQKQILKSNLLIFIFGFIAGSIWQIHYGMLFLYFAIGYLFWKEKKKLTLYLIGIATSFIPLLIFDFRHDFYNLKNILSFITGLATNNSLVHSTSINLSKLFDYYILPGTDINSLIKTVIFLGLYLIIIRQLFISKKQLDKIVLIGFLVFPVTLFFFKRDFDYYLSCFIFWFYLGLTHLGMRKFISSRDVMRLFIPGCVLIFIIGNLIFYSKTENNIYRYSIQKEIADQINNYSKKNNIKQFDIIVKPHQDDSRGIEYLLLNDFDISIYQGKKNKFVICYFNKCNIDKNWRKVFQQEKVDVYFLNDEIASLRSQ